MSYTAFAGGGFGDDYGDQFAAGTWGVGSQSYYGRDSYAMPDPSASAPAPASGDGGSESTAATAPASSGGGGGTPPPQDDTGGGVSGATILIGFGAVAALGYVLFRGLR